MEELPALIDALPIPQDSPAHPITISKTCLIVVVFAHSRSVNFKPVMSLAEQASTLDQFEIESSVFYVASFDRSSKQTSAAIAILNLIKGWKGSYVFVGGRVAHDIGRIMYVLDCFQMSARCNNIASHCHVVIKERGEFSYYNDDAPAATGGLFASLFGGRPEPKPEPVKWLHPCRMIAYQHDCRLDRDHPSSFSDQLQAHAVRGECDWCPNFNLGQLRRL